MSPRRVAAFDFDGTIARGDTVIPFLAFVAGRSSTGRALWAQRRSLRTIRSPTWREDRKAETIGLLLTGRSAVDVDAAGRDYAATLPRRYRPETLRRIDWHRRQGHELVIVSASLLSYLGPAATDLRFDHVIAVELAADSDGMLTGHLARPNVRGPEKARRLREWLEDESAEVWAYGDSAGDADLLALADHPVKVKRRGNPLRHQPVPDQRTPARTPRR